MIPHCPPERGTFLTCLAICSEASRDFEFDDGHLRKALLNPPLQVVDLPAHNPDHAFRRVHQDGERVLPFPNQFGIARDLRAVDQVLAVELDLHGQADALRAHDFRLQAGELLDVRERFDDAEPRAAVGAIGERVAMTAIGITGAFSRDFFVGDSRVFVVSYFLAGKWGRDLIHWIMIGDELRQPFVDQVVLQGAAGAAYSAAFGLLLVTFLPFPGEA